MNMNNVFKKILIATSLITLAFSSLAFAAVNNNSQVEKEKVTITVTSDIEIVKRTFNPEAQKGSGNEFTETKISVSDLKNGDAVFCEKDENGKVTKIVFMEKPERQEGSENKPQGRFGKGFDRATRSYASRADGFKPDRGQRPEGGQGERGQGNKGENNQNRQGNPPTRNGNPPSGENFKRRIQKKGSFGVIESISGNTITLSEFKFKAPQKQDGAPQE